MASLRIQDQENIAPELRQKAAVAACAPLQQRRPILAPIEPNRIETRPQGGKSRGLVAPVVPVAQFEAFKVYEDDENMARIDQRLRMISRSNVYKGTAEDRFITKAELAERQRMEEVKTKNAAPKNGLLCDEERTPQAPMSIGGKTENLENGQLAEDVILKKDNHKDAFFEMEEYRHDIYAYLREHELKNRPKPGYIVKQPDVTDNMRSILVDWLVEVAEEYRMHTETLYLAINFIDRFLSYMSVVRAKLQLVGTAAMFIASKYEEIFPPDVSEFVYITDDTYDKQQVLRMEHLILKVLGFDLSVPTPLTFINALCIGGKIPEKTLYLAMYLSELSVLEVEPYLQFLPSTIAASAVALARHTLGEEPWNECLTSISGFALKDLKKCITFLYEMFVKAPSHPQHAIQDKYKSKKYLQVARLEPSEKMINYE